VKDYAIVMLDPEGRIQSWNAGAHRIKGYTAPEIIGQHFSRFYPEDAIAAGAPRRMLTTAAAQGRVEDLAWRVRKDGSQFWGDIVITAVRGREGNVIGYLKVTRDLSEQRRAQERINALNEDLQRRATLLETANRELEAFSYSVSHDLRAPLRHIDGFANLLTKHAGPMLDAEGRRYIDTISRAAKQMGTLIDNLLAFSRIGRAPLRHEFVDQQQLVNSIIAEGGFGGREHPVSWQVEPLPAVWADTAMLRQVWLNLIANAVKYTSKTPEPRIAIGSHRDAATGEYVLFVRDNGVGFDMAHVDKLFGVFQRLHGPTEFEGTGIGLANVRRIVLRHGGRTWAEGRVNEGATFYFSLPAAAQSPA
jgi:PAS domain S-box-containing protein